jgi:ABC-type multidrug transport system fused ATPase/permease subunit
MMFVGNLWNVIDFIPLLLVTASITITYLPLTRHRITEQRYLNAIALFLLWIRVLYFFRIERSYSYLINLLQSVCQSIATFLALLSLTVVSFAGSFYMLSQNNPQSDNYAPTYLAALHMSIELAFGNYDTTQFGSVGFALTYLFFLIASLALIVVMMNLLISIVSNTYQALQERASVTLYKELSLVISEHMSMVEP